MLLNIYCVSHGEGVVLELCAMTAWGMYPQYAASTAEDFDLLPKTLIQQGINKWVDSRVQHEQGVRNNVGGWAK